MQVIVLGSQTDESLYLGFADDDRVRLKFARDLRQCAAYLREAPQKNSFLLLDAAGADQSFVQGIPAMRAMCPALYTGVAGKSSSDGSTSEARDEAGADTFLRLPVALKDMDGLLSRLRMSRPQLFSTVQHASMHVEELGDGAFFLAASPAMRKIYEQIALLGPNDVNVLITGESGSGKEVVAKLLHKRSTRSARPMMKVNCAALPTDLLESELFGYEAGAFTGALRAKPGKFELCDKGTILLDEIGEMSPHLQAKLLHVLQDGEFSRLGARANVKADVRVIAATNIDMAKAVEEKRFREDLFYRLNTFVLHIPPLRERPAEIPYLLHESMKRLACQQKTEAVSFSPRIIAAAVAYSWPGNVRELNNFVKRFLILRDEVVAVTELESKTMRKVDIAQDDSEGALKTKVRAVKEEVETTLILETLVENNWNRRITAERLQMSYKTLQHKMRQYRLVST